jgi:uncharacterized protein (TIGR00251 family)
VESRKSGTEPPHCLIAIKAIPNAPRHEVVGWLGDAIKIKVHAPPVEGRANEALCEFLADKLSLPRRAVAVQRGDTSRLKTVRIDGLTLAEVHARLGLALPPRTAGSHPVHG